MTTLRPEEGEIAASSNLKREDTLVVAMEMVQDHPWLGVGLGNFREVSRQMYSNPYFRPPHNSYLWALAEGGVFVFAGYLVLLTVTWRDARAITRLARRDREIGHIVAAFRLVFLLYCFFCLFADLWHTPLTYILIGLVVTMRRYLESLPDAAAPAVLVPRRPVWVRAAS
jgi:O-antigen ligase